MRIENGSTILFQGDSITDCGRRENENGLGNGYVQAIAEYLAKTDKNIKVINRACSGDRTANLIERFDEDFLKIKADYVSLMIGVNDTWHFYGQSGAVTDEEFASNLEKILSGIKNKMKTKLIMIEPFLIQSLESNYRMRDNLWRKVNIYRAAARKYADLYISVDGVFAEHIENPADFYSTDAVHPTREGHLVIADLFLKKTGLK